MIRHAVAVALALFFATACALHGAQGVATAPLANSSVHPEVAPLAAQPAPLEVAAAEAPPAVEVATVAAASVSPAPSATGASAQPAPAEPMIEDGEGEGQGDDAAADGEGDGAGEGEPEGEGEAEAEAEGDPAAADDGPRYSADISDAELEKLWKDTPDQLGSISFGFAHEGRVVNAVRFPTDPAWMVVSPAFSWGTQETVDYIVTAIREVKKLYPEAPPLRVNQLSGPEGGYLRPHKSHQNGRDVDLAFYYPTAEVIRVRERERYIDVEKNWALLKALVALTDVQLVLVDRRVIKVLYDHALQAGEDKAWLDSVFRAGANSLVKHARRHRDHFHVRFYNGRAQELGRRLAPLLALRPEHNIAMHRVRSGDTLSGIAVRYNSSVRAIMRASGLRSTFLRLRQVLKVPLRKPCTRCPVPPATIVPPRRLPPAPAMPTAQAHPEAAAVAVVAAVQEPAAVPPAGAEEMAGSAQAPAAAALPATATGGSGEPPAVLPAAATTVAPKQQPAAFAPQPRAEQPVVAPMIEEPAAQAQ